MLSFSPMYNSGCLVIRRSNVLQLANMTDHSYEQIDGLFRDIKLRLAGIRAIAPEAADDLKGLITQLELWFESLVIDSLKLENLEHMFHRTAELARDLQQKLDDEDKGKASPGSESLLDKSIGPAHDSASDFQL